MLGRLTRSEDFERLRKEGARWRGKYCTLNAARAQEPSSSRSSETITRVGYIASKTVGGAVQRNRARRLLKEAARALQENIPSGWDIALIAQPAMTKEHARFQQVRDDVQWLLNRASITNTTR
jgi:ribonuclease P protein component